MKVAMDKILKILDWTTAGICVAVCVLFLSEGRTDISFWAGIAGFFKLEAVFFRR